MLTTAAVLSLMQTFAVPAIDANEVNRTERLTTIATAVWTAAERATCTGQWRIDTCKPIASDPFQVAAEVAGLANLETALRSNVHADRCGIHQCDAIRLPVKGGTVVIHRARSLWQLHRAPEWSATKWDSFSGDSLEATTAAAWQATMMLQGYRGTCHNGTIGAMAGYATGGRCHYRDAARRARMVEVYRVQLVAFAQKSSPWSRISKRIWRTTGRGTGSS